MKLRALIMSLGLVAAAGFSGQIFAQQVSLGEASSVFSCFYECKPGPIVQGVPTRQEVTSIVLANQSNRDILAQIVFLDSNQNIIAWAVQPLSGEDLDEFNVCSTLDRATPSVPQIGLIEVILLETPPGPTGVGGTPTVGVYGWIKNLLGKFFITDPEPFNGRVTGIAKTECRLVPPTVTTFDQIQEKIATQVPPPELVDVELIENSFD